VSETVLMTGASFGRDTAETLARAGHTVFALMRGFAFPEPGIRRIAAQPGIDTVERDVGSDDLVDRAVKEVLVLCFQRMTHAAPDRHCRA